jgi:hypothetical protein
MDSTNILPIGIIIIGVIALIGFFKTKTTGFGKYSTCALVLLVSLIFSSLLHAGGILDSQFYTNALMAIIGFAGGLVVSKE